MAHFASYVRLFGLRGLGGFHDHNYVRGLIANEFPQLCLSECTEENSAGLWRLSFKSCVPDPLSGHITALSIWINLERQGALVKTEATLYSQDSEVPGFQEIKETTLQEIGGLWVPREYSHVRLIPGTTSEKTHLSFRDFTLGCLSDPCSSGSLVLPPGTGLSDNIREDYYNLQEPTTLEDILEGGRTSLSDVDGSEVAPEMTAPTSAVPKPQSRTEPILPNPNDRSSALIALALALATFIGVILLLRPWQRSR